MGGDLRVRRDLDRRRSRRRRRRREIGARARRSGRHRLGAAPPWGEASGRRLRRGETRRRTMKVSVCARGWKIARGAMVRVGRGRDARGIVSCRASGHFRTGGGRRRAPASTPSHSALTRARSAATNSPRVLNPSAATGAGGGGRAEPSVDGSVSNHAVTASRDTDASCARVRRSAGTGQRPVGGNGDGSENTGGGDKYLEERVHRADAGVRDEAEGRASPRGSGCPSLFELRTSGS